MSREQHSHGLDRVVDEAREHLVPSSHGPRHDWRAADEALFDRISREPPLTAAVAPVARRPVFAIASGVALAAAAAATLIFRPAPPAPRAGASEVVATIAIGAGARIVSPTGEVRSANSPLHVGDRLTTDGEAVGFLSRSETGAQAVAWRVERDSNLTVGHARAPLGLALEGGAVEADVAKVKQGEAFVVDVGPVRVAVRGTHLRVGRDHDHATVDLSEGTIAIGPIPAVGLTEGTLVKAPAHVDIDLTRPDALRIENGAAAVRARAFEHDVTAPVAPVAAIVPPSAVPMTAPPPRVVPRPTTTAPLKPQVPADTRAPNEIVADAVRACIEKNIPTGPVRVTVTTSLLLDVDPSGAVKLARFEPPLPPEVQSCASDTIYKTRFASSGGSEQIGITVER